MIPNSIRWRLPLSYAAIALVAVLALGLVLLTILRSYYARQELNYLAENAHGLSLEMSRLVEAGLPEGALQAQLLTFSFLTQTRVRWLDAAGQLTADSGEPRDQRQVYALSVEVEHNQVVTHTAASPERVTIEAITTTLTAAPDVTPFYAPFLFLEASSSPTETDRLLDRTVIFRANGLGSGPAQETEDEIWFDRLIDGPVEPGVITQTRRVVLSGAPGQTGPLPSIDFISALPASRTPYGFSLNPAAPVDGGRTSQVIEQPVYDSAGQLLGTLELSQGPAYGRDIVTSVAWGWAIAGSAAVVVAAAAGWLISRRLTRPLLALTEVTNQMANGDLSVRADVARRDELGALAGSFNDMAARVEHTVSTLRRFVSDAAHELHTPLTALRTNLELAAAPEPVDRPSFLAQAQAQVERLELLTTSLLDLSRLEAETSEITYAPLDLRELVLAAAEAYASRADQAELAFTIEIDTPAAIVNGHAGQLRRVLDNLLDNAFKFSAAGGQVALGLKRSPDLSRVIVWVADNGLGLVEDDVPQLFQRFHRGRNAAAYPGSGLGLAIVRVIIAGHGGQVWAEPAPVGARFSFWLPVIPQFDGQLGLN